MRQRTHTPLTPSLVVPILFAFEQGLDVLTTALAAIAAHSFLVPSEHSVSLIVNVTLCDPCVIWSQAQISIAISALPRQLGFTHARIVSVSPVLLRHAGFISYISVFPLSLDTEGMVR